MNQQDLLTLAQSQAKALLATIDALKTFSPAPAPMHSNADGAKSKEAPAKKTERYLGDETEFSMMPVNRTPAEFVAYILAYMGLTPKGTFDESKPNSILALIKKDYMEEVRRFEQDGLKFKYTAEQYIVHKLRTQTSHLANFFSQNHTSGFVFEQIGDSFVPRYKKTDDGAGYSEYYVKIVALVTFVLSKLGDGFMVLSDWKSIFPTTLTRTKTLFHAASHLHQFRFTTLKSEEFLKTPENSYYKQSCHYIACLILMMKYDRELVIKGETITKSSKPARPAPAVSAPVSDQKEDEENVAAGDEDAHDDNDDDDDEDAEDDANKELSEEGTPTPPPPTKKASKTALLASHTHTYSHPSQSMHKMPPVPHTKSTPVATSASAPAPSPAPSSNPHKSTHRAPPPVPEAKRIKEDTDAW